MAAVAIIVLALAVIVVGVAVHDVSRTTKRIRQRTVALEGERGAVRTDLLNLSAALRLHEARIQALEALREPEPPPLPPRGDLHPQQFLPDFPG